MWIFQKQVLIPNTQPFFSVVLHSTDKIQVWLFNLFQYVMFHIEASHLFCSAKQLSSFYMECNSVLKWVNLFITRPFEELPPVI